MHRESGTAGILETCIFEIIALNQKTVLNLLTNFLRSIQIHKGHTSDIGTLKMDIGFVYHFKILSLLVTINIYLEFIA